MTPSNIELPFAKKLALNPALTMFDSLLRDYYRNDHFIDFTIKSQHPYELIPMAQSFNDEIKIPQKNHIVIVIMESMMAKNLSFHGGNPRTTPYLNKLRELSVSFDHAYTAGIHTFNGIYSTIFSHPALFRDQPMQNMKNNQRANIAKSLQAINYTTNYFTTHVDYFDNAGPFLSSAGFQNIFSVKHYPPELAPTPMGVPDHIQFNFVIETMNHQHARGEKILSVIMTGSNHNPYVLPKDIEFEAPFKNLKHDVTAYADWSIGNFLDQAKKEAWFNETLFVFVADHGLVKNPVFDMPLSYYHTPLLFYSHDIEPKSVSHLASQMDIYPTVMGILAQPFENTTQGINLLNNKRNYVFLNNDEKTALLSENEFFILYETGETLFYTDWKNKNVRDFKYEQPQAAQALKENLLENIRRILTN
jgi:phosphoglycerol transferase MdoB-like AlkP superfamily enzyme